MMGNMVFSIGNIEDRVDALAVSLFPSYQPPYNLTTTLSTSNTAALAMLIARLMVLCRSMHVYEFMGNGKMLSKSIRIAT